MSRTPDTGPVSQFMKLLNGIDRSKRRSEVFFDFCELAFCALAKNACPWPDRREALEAQYMDVVRRYRDKDDIRKMPELLALTVKQVAVGGCDFLGAVAGEVGALDAKLGQFFTPYDVSRLMAEINLSNASQIIEQKGFITVSEPAAGAGCMVIAVADVFERAGFDPARHLWVEATDLSVQMYYLSFIQISLRGIAGRVIRGDTLRMEMQQFAYTAAAQEFIMANGHPFADQRKAAPNGRAPEETISADFTVQGDLFAPPEGSTP